MGNIDLFMQLEKYDLIGTKDS